jgi:CRISPR associated protein Cas2 family
VSAEKRWRLVCYDVRNDVRYRKVFKIVRGAGESVQYSVFRCRLDDLETERLRWRLSQVIGSWIGARGRRCRCRAAPTHEKFEGTQRWY